MLEEAHYGSLSVQSNAARTGAEDIAAAASLGFITTWTPEGFGRRWVPTGPGLVFLENSYGPLQ